MRPRFNSLNSAKVRLSVLLSALTLIPAGIFVLSQRANAQQTVAADTLNFAPIDLYASGDQFGAQFISGTLFLPAVQNGLYHVEVFTNYGSITMDFGAGNSNQGFYVFYETPPQRKTWRLHLQRYGSNEDHVLDLPSDTFDVLTTVRVHPATNRAGQAIRAESAGLEVEGYPVINGENAGWSAYIMSPLQGR